MDQNNKLFNTRIVRDSVFFKNKKNKSVKNKLVTNKLVKNKLVTNKLVTNKLVTNKLVTNKLVKNKLVTNKLVTNKLVTNKLVTNKLVKNKLVKNKLVKNIVRKSRRIVTMDLTIQDFNLFYKKFIGLLIKKGRRGLAYKMVSDLLFYIKKINNKQYKNPLFVLHQAANKLNPVLTKTVERMGYSSNVVPTFATKKIRLRLLLSWMLRMNMGSTNIRGINPKDLATHIVAASLKKGKLIKVKKQYLLNCLQNKHFLKDKRLSHYEIKKWYTSTSRKKIWAWKQKFKRRRYRTIRYLGDVDKLGNSKLALPGIRTNVKTKRYKNF